MSNHQGTPGILAWEVGPAECTIHDGALRDVGRFRIVVLHRRGLRRGEWRPFTSRTSEPAALREANALARQGYRVRVYVEQLDRDELA